MSRFEKIIESERFSIELVGNLVGTKVSKDTSIRDRDQSINDLSGFNSIEEISGYVRKSLGDFVLRILNVNDSTLYIICSPSSKGIYYTVLENDLTIYFDEKVAYQSNINNGLNELEIVNTIESHHGLRNPKQCLVNGVFRVIGGEYIKFSNGVLENNYYSVYSHDELEEHKIPDQYTNLSENLTQTLQIFDKQIEKSKYLLLSGGIDSVYLLILISELGLDIEALHWPIHQSQELVAKSIAEKLNIPIHTTNYNPKEINEAEKRRRITEIYKHGIGVMSYWNGASFSLEDFKIKNEIESPVFFSGQNMDSFYSIDNYAPGYERVGLRRLKDKMTSISKRMRYTYPFIKITSSLKGKEKTLTEYLCSLNYPLIEHTVPLENPLPVLPSQLGKIEEEFIQYKEKTLVDPILKIFQNSPKQSDLLLNHLIRFSKRLRFISNTPRLYNYYDTFFGFQRILPVLEGPVSSDLMQFKLSSKDAISIKQYLHKYFKKAIGKNFIDYKDEIISRSTGLNKRYLDLKRERSFLASVLREFNLSESYLLDNIKNKDIRFYIESLYQRLKKENDELAKKDLMRFERMLNLELFFRNL